MVDEVTSLEPDSDLQELLGEGPIPFPTRAGRTFQPWHRPRKQYVRNLQWSKEIGYLVRDLKLSEGELRYLTLPGSDLLDVRYIHDQVCTPNNVRLKYLGFNTAARAEDSGQSELNSTEFSIKRLAFIDPESEVFPGDFRQVGDDKSVPWARVRRAGQFHAINLDLCGGFAGIESSGGIPNYFTALQWILQNQASGHEEFLLFITTRMDSDSIDPGDKARLEGVAQSILDRCSSYADGFRTAWGVSSAASEVKVPDVAKPTEAFMLGLTQWIVSRGIDCGLKASVKSFMTYRTGAGEGEDDIVSLAIRFKPDPVILSDPHGLVRPLQKSIPREQKECLQSNSIPGKVSGRTLIDTVLRTEAEEFRRCMSETSALLSSTGYDPDEYRDWVMEESARYAIA